MLLNAFRRKVGSEEVFGAMRDVYEGRAVLLVMEDRCRGIEVPAADVTDTTMKWDFAGQSWYESKEQIAVSI
jgi:hypothetical protein